MKRFRRMSPSRYTALQSCLLREVWYASGNAPLLPPSPLAELGSVIHRLLEEAGRGQFKEPQENAIEAAWSRLINEAEKRMSMSVIRLPHVPLKKSISDFEVRKLRACRQAESIAREATHAREDDRRQTLQPPSFERWVETDDGMVGGYIDHVKTTDKGVVISDYKTGSFLDSGPIGKPREVKRAYKEQLELYAALYRYRFGMWPAVLEIIPLQGASVEVPFAKRHAKRLLETARRSLQTANKMIDKVTHGNTDVASLASPRAENCRLCLFRPECRAYWTARKLDPQQKWPSDVRGCLREIIVLRNGKLCLTIAKDPSSPLTVSIRNLDSSEDRHPLLRSIQRGSQVEVYSLKYLPRSGDYLETVNTVIYAADRSRW